MQRDPAHDPISGEGVFSLLCAAIEPGHVQAPLEFLQHCKFALLGFGMRERLSYRPSAQLVFRCGDGGSPVSGATIPRLLWWFVGAPDRPVRTSPIR
jgi:hypothetical protein